MNKENRKMIISWCMYDWANSAFATTILTAVLPIFYSLVAANGLPKATATSYWGFTNSIAMIIIALSSPLLGSIGDHTARRKRFLFGFASIGITSTALLFLIKEGQWLFASILFVFGWIGFGGGNVFYDSLLPFVAQEHIIDQVSSLGYALGYLGGGILLAINLLMIKKPEMFLVKHDRLIRSGLKHKKARKKLTTKKKKGKTVFKGSYHSTYKAKKPKKPLGPTFEPGKVGT